ncbi:hypothetical protein JF544_00985 [Halobacillus kuroshimensis]|uniref:Fur-regulated basic protein FbpA n=1 Tax=Halobacillus kuroshimensis TaxID=302481 RepID=A0ABS3DR23_9BACI|nr:MULTISPECIES: hypothetical protein [Halobacillus]MBN8233795.1 hypothetical protein [Halobacillus kuroshimensis]
MLMSAYPPEKSFEDRYALIDHLRNLGYTEDLLGKKTVEMTLPELQQIYINLEYQREERA